MLIARARFRAYGPTLAWAGLLLVINVQSWWAMFGMRNRIEWSFVDFVIILLQAAILYMLAAIVLPDVRPDDAVDLRAHYFEHVAWFYGLGVFLLIVSVMKDVIVGGRLHNTANLAFHGLFFVTWLIAAVTRREWYHRLLPIIRVAIFDDPRNLFDELTLPPQASETDARYAPKSGAM